MTNYTPFSMLDLKLFRLRLSLLLLFAFLGVGADAQSTGCSPAPVQIDETVAQIHAKPNHAADQDLLELGHELLRERRLGLPYVQIVVLQVDIDAQGKVIAVTPVSGLPELTNMYVYRLQRISYIPFKENGQAVCVRFIAKLVPRISPETGPEFVGRDKFNSLLKKCSDLSASGSGTAELTSACQQAADAGDHLPDGYFGKDKRLAYVMTATALMRANHAKDALAYAEEAVKTADLGFDDISGKAAAYGVRGQARGLTGDLPGANEDLTKAEELERATFEVPRKPEQKAFDAHALKSMLGFHAEVLTAMGKKADAEGLRDEAKKL